MKRIQLLLTCIALFAAVPAVFSQPAPPAYSPIHNAPNKAKNAYNDGVTEARQGNTPIAIGYFERALKECPTFIDAQLLLAGSHLKLKDYARAEEGFKKVIALDDKYQPGAFTTLAHCE